MDDVKTPVRKRFKTETVSGIVGYRLRRAQMHIFQQFNLHFAEFDLRPAEFSVLALIADNPGSKQTEIAHALGIKRANFVALINGLEARGFTERRLPAGDRRSHALFLTSLGKEMMTRLRKTQSEFEARWVTRLGGPEARDQLLALLDRLVAKD
ncbi:MAG: winged helix-turn-helix transcriptional regulator [Devosia nanyangense]|uniref:Winged helix-turn-helix transcriptional regulator n=1 Tax=Devosia nanyangense TaxID=1228055 RepID=A0A933L230_9HYPH|nr:winged helix-turn-helix transcriptional regulator [Devosia nanyangense]